MRVRRPGSWFLGREPRVKANNVPGERQEEGQAMPITRVQELFARELGEIYDAEHRFLEGQQEMVERATDEELQRAIRNHILQTQQHIGNLEQVFRELGQEPRRETNEVARGLASEAQESLKETQGEAPLGDALRDCAINAAVAKVEHFEMASYRSMLPGARRMGETEIANLLEANLRQEENAAQIAERSAEELFQKALTAEEMDGGGLIDKAIGKVKDRLTGQ